MRKILFCYCMLLSAFSGLHAQKEANIWYFGKNAGLDFNGGTPTALLDGQMNTNEGVATIADIDGNLLFYTDGMYVFNKDHELMQNGIGLMGDSSTSQSAVIVAKPLSPTIYYIFTLSFEGNDPGLRYSEVDITLDGGLGAVTENKNVPLTTPCTEHLTAVGHSNGTDVWVIVHGFGNNAFHSFLVTPDGVNDAAVTSNSGQALEGSMIGTVGCMKVSPPGTKLGICNYLYGVRVFDFNPATGIVSAPLLVDSSDNWYGLEFSPSGEILYATNDASGAITQYDLTEANVPASATIVLTAADPISGGSLQLGPDGKIYRAASSFSYLSVIHDPNIAGEGCNAELEGVSLGGQVSNLGLPNFVQSFFAYGIRAEHLCFGDATEFSVLSPMVPQAVTWNFGDGTGTDEFAPFHTYAAAGTYLVTATLTLNGDEQIVEKSIIISPLPEATPPGNLYACDENDDGQESFDLEQQDAIILGEQNPEEYQVSYHVSQNDAEDGINALAANYTNTDNPQTIYARVENNATGCYSITAFTLNIIEKPEILMENQYAFCEDGSVTIIAPEGFESYLWSTGETTASITVNEPGILTITVTKDINGVLCEASKEISVVQSVQPVIEGIIIKDWTDTRNSIEVAVSAGDSIEYSLDGIHWQDSPEFTNLEPGIYEVHVRDKNGCGADSEEVYLLACPKFFTPNNDGTNETWRITFGNQEPAMIVHIYDRYGKIITSFKGGDAGWDGTLNGCRLPATDYWFVVHRHGGGIHKGHFSLIR